MAKDTKKKPAAKKKSAKKRQNVIEGRVTILAGFRNTIAWSSSGASGFKGSKKATPYAAQVASENATEKAKVFGLAKVDVFVKGIGSGREQALRGLIASGLEIQSINDVTPV